MKYLILVVGFLFLENVHLNAQSTVLLKDESFRNSARAAIDSLYNQNPKAAREMMKPWSQANPDHPLWSLWEGMELWWKILTDIYDESMDEEFYRTMKQADRAAVELLSEDSSHTDAYLIRAVANGYIARHYSNREEWIPSLRTARTAEQNHRMLGKLAPELSDNLFAEGLKKYYAAYLPEAYPVIRAVSWLLPSGDKAEGLDLLEKTSREAVFAQPEAIYFLGNILLNYEEDYERALFYVHQLVDRYPNNSFYRRLLVRILFRLDETEQVMEVVGASRHHWIDQGLSGLNVLEEELLYWKGRMMLSRRNFAEAASLFTRSYEIGKSLPNPKKRSFHVLSGYYAGLTSEWQGEIQNARNYYRQIVDMECEEETRNRAKKRLGDL